VRGTVGEGYRFMEAALFSREETMAVKGSCHCGATQFTMAKRPATVTRCTCSFCSKRGSFWAYQDNAEDFVLTTSRSRIDLSVGQLSYRTSSLRSAVVVHGRGPPFWDQETKQSVAGKFQVQVNAWLVENFDPNAQPIKVLDGKTLW